MESSRNNLLEALKQVERRTENSASGWRLLLYGLILLPLATILIAALFESMWWHPFILLFGGYGVLTLTASIRYNQSLRRIVRNRLEASSLAVQLASGVLQEDQVILSIPKPLLRMYLGSPVIGSLTDAIQRVAWNLDWYLSPPRVYWRLIWLYIPIASVATVVLFSNLLALIVGNLSIGMNAQLPELVELLLGLMFTIHLDGLTLIAVILFVSPLPFVYHRRQIWTEELVRHLRERLQA